MNSRHCIPNLPSNQSSLDTSMGRQEGCKISGGNGLRPDLSQHLGIDPLKLRVLTVDTISWSMNCPHCMNMRVTVGSSTFLSLCILTLMSLAEGSWFPDFDLRTS